MCITKFCAAAKSAPICGRCISGDFQSHSSYRVTSNSVQLGKAAGADAAVTALQDKLPHEVAWTEVKAVLGYVIS